ncbi:hypothetical protein [Methyloceanibacter caenitepidi]|uniref:Uncharacterized protein n=1 Tax=Methyloceanibacter caenitepidi TaxID=1384459 RepID=A0A0A8K8U6_9HYPH|nr:hypothetical protein [Methyloceanibacter caenitepidi]BAQ18404.1 hypothetical protein GL4_2972 [Methyloceanibacter caenitepidi]
MNTSVFLAQLMGPVMLVAAIGLLVNPEAQRDMARQFLDSPPLIYVTGFIVMTAGLAVVLNHNVWALDWRLIITLFGWMAVIGGAIRMLCFSAVKKIGYAMLDKPGAATIGGVVWLIIGAVLCYFGYFA